MIVLKKVTQVIVENPTMETIVIIPYGEHYSFTLPPMTNARFSISDYKAATKYYKSINNKLKIYKL